MIALSAQQKLDTGWYWRVPACLDLVHAPLTERAVSEAEARLGVKLPAVYVTLLRTQNGGALRATWPASYSQALWGIGERAPSITHESARWRRAQAGAWAPKRAELLVPFDGDDVWHMCFDYRKRGPTGEPTITLVDSECAEEEPVAADFAAFLAGLVDRLAQSVRVHADAEPEPFARSLARKLGSAPPHLAHADGGFASWRIALRGDHQWCWVSPNRVPATFRRVAGTSRPSVSERTALQLPEDAACTLLVSCTAESRAAVEAALADETLTQR